MKNAITTEESDEPPSGGSYIDYASPQEAPTPLGTDTLTNLPYQPSRKTILTANSKKLDKPRLIHIFNGNERFAIGFRTSKFRKKFYPRVPDSQWNDWHWQLRNRINSVEGLNRVLILSDSEIQALRNHSGPLPSSITPYYASLLDRTNPQQALRRTVVMVSAENEISHGESVDPLHEDEDSPVPGIVHRYPDRALFLVTGTCAVYCRYCTRSRMVGHHGGEYRFNLTQWENALEYLRQHTEIRDVILSGGDPLTISNDKLAWLLSRLRRIRHIEIIRIGTKIPVVLPNRITNGLLRSLKKYHPIWMSIHFTHPDEITPEVAEACNRLADAGFPLGSQTVLLKGINDNVEIQKQLYHKLMQIRVKPYYLYQCDPVAGTSHFRTSVSKGLEIIAGLRGFTSGYAVPNFVVDAPGGGGKIALLPDNIAGRNGDSLLLRNFEGQIFEYPDPLNIDG